MAEWFQDMYFLTLQNQQSYNELATEQNQIVSRFSEIEWRTFDSLTHMQYLKHISISEVHVGDTTDAEENKVTLFNVKESKTRLTSRVSNGLDIVVSASIEMSFDLTKVIRHDKSFGDFLSDIGGMFGFMLTLGRALTLALTLDGAQYFVTSSLLKTHEKKGMQRKATVSLQTSFFQILRLNLGRYCCFWWDKSSDDELFDRKDGKRPKKKKGKCLKLCMWNLREQKLLEANDFFKDEIIVADMLKR